MNIFELNSVNNAANLTPLFIFFGVIVTIFVGISLIGRYYSLNKFKNKTVGNGQHGAARMATPKEEKETYQFVPFTPDLWRQGEALPTAQGIVVGSKYKGSHKTTAIVDTGDVHAILTGAAGMGKTAYFLYPNIEYACASGMSFIATDTKGDLYRNAAGIAKNYYDYDVSIIDLRKPTKSDGFNLLHIVNKYMDLSLENPDNLAYRAKAEKYAKTVAKTIISADENTSTAFGQNAFFYDAAEGLITASVLIVSEFSSPESRHIISVFKLIQDLLAPSNKKDKNRFQILMEKLPPNHKARWFAGAALNSPQAQMLSVISTALSRLNSFIDSELEQILCFDTAIDAEKFCKQKSAIFIVMPEEDAAKYFLVSLIVQQLYREILTVADDYDGRLKRKVMMYLDELGTITKIQSIQMMYSAIRSRNVGIVGIIQSSAQLREKYGQEGAKIIEDNCQLSIYCGFAPNSEDANIVSKNLGTRTVLSGSVSHGQNASESLQMIERPLMTADELKTMKRGTFLVTKTGSHPSLFHMKLYTKWGIDFDKPYLIEDRSARKVTFVNEKDISRAIESKFCFNNSDDYDEQQLSDLPIAQSTQAFTSNASEQIKKQPPAALQPKRPLHKKTPLRTD